MIYKRLNNGTEIPMLGFGTYKLSDPEETVRCVMTAVEAGYRLIDTAKFYRNEGAVGAGIKKALDAGLAEREDLFVITKVWYDSYEREDCIRSLEDSFEKLGLDVIDMVLLHWPFGNVYAAWRVLEEYCEAGRIRSIGVSNMPSDRLIDLARFNKISPALDQVEAHLYCQQIEERKWLSKYGTAVQAYAPLGHGKAGEMFLEPAVKDLAAKYKKTPAQILLRFLLQNDICMIPKSSHEERISENIDIFDFSLNREDMEILTALDRAKPMIGRLHDPSKAEEMLAETTT